jgi:hypothetical protein
MKASFQIDYDGSGAETLQEKGKISGRFQRALGATVSLEGGGTHYPAVSIHPHAIGPTTFSTVASKEVIGAMIKNVVDAGFDVEADNTGKDFTAKPKPQGM